MSWKRAREERWTVEKEGAGEGGWKEQRRRSRNETIGGEAGWEEAWRERIQRDRILHCKSCTKARLTTGKDCSVHSQTSLTGNKLSLQR